MMIFRSAAFALATLTALPAAAETVGQPFLVMEEGLSGSTFNYFQDSFPGPSGLNDLKGIVTQEFGAPGSLGKAFSLTIGFDEGPSDDNLLKFGDATLGFYNDEPAQFDLHDYLKQVGPKELMLSLVFYPAFENDTLPGDLAIFPVAPGWNDNPQYQLSILLNTPAATKIFEDTDGEGNVVDTFEYLEGPLDIRRITLGRIGGEPLPPPAVVPLPASVPLLGAALAVLFGLRGLSLRRKPRILV